MCMQKGKGGGVMLEASGLPGKMMAAAGIEGRGGRTKKAKRSPGEENGKRLEMAAEAVFYLLVFASIMCFAMVQTYGDPPDEINRFKVVNYICKYGRLPHGADPEVLLDGYGASYAFQPMLTYIIQGFLLRFLKLFTEDGYILLLAARTVNAVFGTLMAYFVRKTAKEAWDNPYIQWTFTVLVVFLPQNIFIHSYVNTDSMAMLSVAMIFYVLLRAQRAGYDKKGCFLLSVGIVLCAMSYYNAYGIILAAILLFFIHFVHFRRGLAVEWKPLLRKGFYISLVVLLGIGWWFGRNAILYNGDIIAMKARRECAIVTSIEEYNPLFRFTFQKAGKSIREMLFETGYITLLRDSFIAMFGPMKIPTHGLIYIGYKWLWAGACTMAFFPIDRLREAYRKRRGAVSYDRNGNTGLYTEREEKKKRRAGCGKEKAAFYICMFLFCAITIGLSIYYSYTWEYQPQGRYILPVLVPFMYLVALGIRKAYLLLEWVRPALGKILCFGVIGYVMAAFAYSLFNRFLPYYLQGENMFSMIGKTQWP